MKSLVAAVMLAFAAVSVNATAPAKKEEPKPAVVQNDNCVKKDKNGKCPPLPNSPKPTPKKPAEKK
jgi:hypothetical protein